MRILILLFLFVSCTKDNLNCNCTISYYKFERIGENISYRLKSQEPVCAEGDSGIDYKTDGSYTEIKCSK